MARQIQLVLANTPVQHQYQHQQNQTPDLKTFSGDREKLREYVAKLKIKAQTQTDTQAKLRYAVSTVSGATFDQVAAFMENDRVNLKDMAEFIQVLGGRIRRH